MTGGWFLTQRKHDAPEDLRGAVVFLRPIRHGALARPIEFGGSPNEPMNHRHVVLAFASVALLTVGALQFASPNGEPALAHGESAPSEGEPEIQHLFVSQRVTASSSTEELAPGAALRYETDWRTTHRIDSTRERSSQEILIQAVGSLDLVVARRPGWLSVATTPMPHC